MADNNGVSNVVCSWLYMLEWRNSWSWVMFVIYVCVMKPGKAEWKAVRMDFPAVSKGQPCRRCKQNISVIWFNYSIVDPIPGISFAWRGDEASRSACYHKLWKKGLRMLSCGACQSKFYVLPSKLTGIPTFLIKHEHEPWCLTCLVHWRFAIWLKYLDVSEWDQIFLI